MKRRTPSWRLSAALSTTMLVASLVGLAAPAAAATCAGPTRTWTDASGDHSWTTAGNWTPSGNPQPTEVVRIEAPGSIVERASGTVCDLILSGSLGLSSALSVTGAASIAAGSVVTLGDGATAGFGGSASLADGVSFRRPAGATGLAPQVRVTGAAVLHGTTTLVGVGLALTEGSSLASGDAAGTVAGTGTLSWQGGSLAGALTLSSPVLVSGGGDRPVAADSQVIVRGSTTISSSRVVLGPRTRMNVSGVLTLAGAAVVARSGAAIEGQQVAVAAGGSLQRVPGTTSDPAVIDVPLLNQGAVTVSGRLDVPAGYQQQQQPDSEVEPVTGLLSATSLLSAGDAAGNYATVDVKDGGFGGIGTVAARTVTIGTGWVHPGFAESSGTLTVRGDLVLSKDSEVQIFVRGAEPEKRDTLVVEGLGSNGTVVAPGRATLGGRISGLLGDGYQPPYGTTVPNVIRYAARTGAFEPVRSITSSGLGWEPHYDDKLKDGDGRGVDLQFVDVAPPTVGLAGVPAFTQRSTQQLTYEAVDNRSGLANFDLRWRKATAARDFTGWRSPKSWRTTTDRSQILRGMDEGWTYCFAVRARDKRGNVSAWSRPQCVARMSDDRALRASSAWSRSSGQSGFYASTFTRTDGKGATLRKKGTFSRVAVTALRCRTCGTLGVYSGTTLLKTLPLKSKRAAPRTWVSKVLTGATGPLVLRVLSSGKPVTVDAVGLLR